MATIRPARYEDIPCLVKLLQQLFTIEADFRFNSTAQSRALSLLIDSDQPGDVFVTEVNDKVVGMCSIQFVVSTAEGGLAAILEDLVINEKYRRQNLGTALLTHAEEFARSLGASRVQLLADMDNSSALNFYGAQGWQTTTLTALFKSEN